MRFKGHIEGLDVNSNPDVVKCDACIDDKKTKTASSGLPTKKREHQVI